MFLVVDKAAMEDGGLVAHMRAVTIYHVWMRHLHDPVILFCQCDNLYDALATRLSYASCVAPGLVSCCHMHPLHDSDANIVIVGIKHTSMSVSELNVCGLQMYHHVYPHMFKILLVQPLIGRAQSLHASLQSNLGLLMFLL